MLGKLLPLLVLATTGCLYPEGGDDGADSWDCSEQVSRHLEVVTPADPPLQFRVDSCRLDRDACQSLCELALSRLGFEPYVTACAVTFAAEVTNVDVTYTRYSDACSASDDAVPVPASGKPN